MTIAMLEEERRILRVACGVKAFPTHLRLCHHLNLGPYATTTDFLHSISCPNCMVIFTISPGIVVIGSPYSLGAAGPVEVTVQLPIMASWSELDWLVAMANELADEPTGARASGVDHD